MVEFDTSHIQSNRALGRARYFFVGQALLFLAVAVVGFAPNMVAYFKGKMPLPWTAHVHGVIMMAWMIAYLVQSWAVASERTMLHRRLGPYLACFGIVVLGAMGIATVTGLTRWHPSINHMTFLYDVMAVQLVMMAWFFIFLLGGVIARTNASWHKRLMSLATLALLQAALDRMHWLPNEGLPVFWHQGLRLYVLMLPMMIFDLVTIRKLHMATIIGGCVFIAGHAFISAVWGTAGWRMLMISLTRNW